MQYSAIMLLQEYLYRYSTVRLQEGVDPMSIITSKEAGNHDVFLARMGKQQEYSISQDIKQKRKSITIA